MHTHELNDRFGNREAIIGMLQEEMIWLKKYWNIEKNYIPVMALNIIRTL